jgi:uncharacterized protein (DUF58 family)
LQDLIKLQLEAKGFSFLPKYAVQSILSGRHRSKLRGRGLDFDEVRKYAIGDDIRNIDWKVTARVGVTHTKEFTEERERPVFLIVDQSKSMFFGSQLYFKSVTASHLAALACWRTIHVGDRIGGIVFNDTKDDYVKPQRNRKTVQQFLSQISKFNQNLNIEIEENKAQNPLIKALIKANQLITHDHLVVVISDVQKVNHDTVKHLIHIKKNNDVIFANISDPLESNLNFNQIVLSDGKYRINISGTSNLRKDYEAKRKAQEEYLKDTLNKYGIPLLPITTAQDTVVQLRNHLSVMQRT